MQIFTWQMKLYLTIHDFKPKAYQIANIGPYCVQWHWAKAPFTSAYILGFRSGEILKFLQNVKTLLA